MRGRACTDEVRQRILETLKTGVPFIALAAEANGVPRKTMETWLDLGKHGDPRYEDFSNEVYRIRAEFLLKHSLELLSCDRETAERARQRNWLLQRIDRSIFDPPKEVYDRVVIPKTREPATLATDPAVVADAVNELSQPLTLQ